MTSPSPNHIDESRGPLGGLGTVLAWARARGLAPQSSGERRSWEGASAVGWLNWGLAFASLLVAATIVWHVGWAIAGSVGSGPRTGSEVIGAGTGETPGGAEDSTEVTQPVAGGTEPGGGSPAGGPETQPGGTGVTYGMQAPPFPSYNSKLRQDLFGVGSATGPAPATVQAGPVPADLKLQGVILGEPPQAIIYDSRRGSTHWVTLGERIGEITIEEIHENTVKISHRDESFDLKL